MPHRPAAWSWPVDTALAVGAGLAFGLLATAWLAPFHLSGPALEAADFQAYCQCVATLREGSTEGWYAMRAITPGLLPAALAAFLGVFDGLATASLLSTMALGTALYLWGRALHGRLAGLAAVLAACAYSPLVILPRQLSFYPEIAALFTLSAALVALGARVRARAGVALGASGVAVAFLADGRGLFHGLPGLLLVWIVALAWERRHGARARRPDVAGWTHRIPRAIAILFSILVVSYVLGHFAFAKTDPLDTLVIRAGSYVGGGTVPGLVDGGPGGVRAVSDGYRWGWSNPVTLVRTLWRLVEAWRAGGDVLAEVPRNAANRAAQVNPWLPLGAFSFLAALAATRKRPWILAALAATVLPFGVSLYAASSWEPTVRFLALAFPALPLLLGVAVAWLVQGAEEAEGAEGAEGIEDPASPRLRRWHIVLPALALALLAVLVFGVVPSFLSPTASWRIRWETTPEALQTVRYAATGEDPPRVPISEVCVRALGEDQDQGHPAGSRWYPDTRQAPDDRPPYGDDREK